MLELKNRRHCDSRWLAAAAHLLRLGAVRIEVFEILVDLGGNAACIFKVANCDAVDNRLHGLGAAKIGVEELRRGDLRIARSPARSSTRVAHLALANRRRCLKAAHQKKLRVFGADRRHYDARRRHRMVGAIAGVDANKIAFYQLQITSPLAVGRPKNRRLPPTETTRAQVESAENNSNLLMIW